MTHTPTPSMRGRDYCETPTPYDPSPHEMAGRHAANDERRDLLASLEAQVNAYHAAHHDEDLRSEPAEIRPHEIRNLEAHAHELALLIADLLTHDQEVQRENWRLRDRLRSLEQKAHNEIDNVRTQMQHHAAQMAKEASMHEPDQDSVMPFEMRRG